MIPIHLTTLMEPGSQFRSQLALATVVYWMERCRPMTAPPNWLTMQFTHPEVEVPEFVPGRVYPGWKIPNSQVWRHKWAYQNTREEFYVLADDDILVEPKSEDGQLWWDFCRNFFRANHRLAMFQPFLLNANSVPRGLPDLVPGRAIGGVRVIRRAAVEKMLERLGDWPEPPETKKGCYDSTITEALSQDDWECGTVSGWWGTHCARSASLMHPDGYHSLIEVPK